MDGFCCVEANPLGPDQLYVTPPLPVKFKLAPTQIGSFETITGVGSGFKLTLVVAVAVHEPALNVTE